MDFSLGKYFRPIGRGWAKYCFVIGERINNNKLLLLFAEFIQSLSLFFDKFLWEAAIFTQEPLQEGEKRGFICA